MINPLISRAIHEYNVQFVKFTNCTFIFHFMSVALTENSVPLQRQTKGTLELQDTKLPFAKVFLCLPQKKELHRIKKINI